MTGNATDRLRGEWDSQAGNWFDQRERLFASSRPIHEWLVAHLEPKDRQRVLEIAAGPGDTGFMAAGRLGAGRLVSTDFSPAMVEAARRRGAELGITNADYLVVDAQAMDFAAGSFDAVLCRWGFMLMPDPLAALRECRRVLVPGGRLVFAVFTGPGENPFAAIPARVLAEAGYLPAPASGWQPGILALADPARLHELLERAGFALTALEGIAMTWQFTDAADFWSFLVELTALGPLVRSLPESARESVRTAITERLAAFTRADGGGIALPSRCWGGVAIA